MTDMLARIVFPSERDRLARLAPPQAGESDADWLTRLVTAKTAVVVTSTEARDPTLYRTRLREAAERYLIVVNESQAAPPESNTLDSERYLAKRRAGKSPDEAARSATPKSP